jgi:dGTPase
VYLGERARREHAKIELVLRSLFEHYCTEPPDLPAGVPGATLAERVTDYLAGMTDRFCIRRFEELSVPRAFEG